jgi:hypothetical protein
MPIPMKAAGMPVLPLLVPERATFAEELEASLEITIPPLNLPREGGAKTTLKVVL